MALAAAMHVDAGWRERQRAERQQATYLQRRFGTPCLVVVFEKAAGKQLPPVPAQRVVIAPVAGDVVEVVAELVTVEEQLPVARETGFQRAAAAVDHARARQHREDRPDQPPVARRA